MDILIYKKSIKATVLCIGLLCSTNLLHATDSSSNDPEERRVIRSAVRPDKVEYVEKLPSEKQKTASDHLKGVNLTDIVEPSSYEVGSAWN